MCSCVRVCVCSGTVCYFARNISHDMVSIYIEFSGVKVCMHINVLSLMYDVNVFRCDCF